MTPEDIEKIANNNMNGGIPATYAIYNNVANIVDTMLDTIGHHSEGEERRHLLYIADGVLVHSLLKVDDIDLVCRTKNTLKSAAELCADRNTTFDYLKRCIDLRAGDIPTKPPIWEYINPIWNIYHTPR